jgi:hypothetical protein
VSSLANAQAMATTSGAALVRSLSGSSLSTASTARRESQLHDFDQMLLTNDTVKLKESMDEAGLGGDSSLDDVDDVERLAEVSGEGMGEEEQGELKLLKLEKSNDGVIVLKQRRRGDATQLPRLERERTLSASRSSSLIFNKTHPVANSPSKPSATRILVQRRSSVDSAIISPNSGSSSDSSPASSRNKLVSTRSTRLSTSSAASRPSASPILPISARMMRGKSEPASPTRESMIPTSKRQSFDSNMDLDDGPKVSSSY